MIALGAVGLAFLLFFGSRWYGFLSQASMRTGLAGIYLGLALLVYAAVDSSAVAKPAELDRLIGEYDLVTHVRRGV